MHSSDLKDVLLLVRHGVKQHGFVEADYRPFLEYVMSNTEGRRHQQPLFKDCESKRHKYLINAESSEGFSVLPNAEDLNVVTVEVKNNLFSVKRKWSKLEIMWPELSNITRGNMTSRRNKLKKSLTSRGSMEGS
ncbi:hypothetical protein Ancab_026159 [Ancistrocladus abbreviatus]